MKPKTVRIPYRGQKGGQPVTIMGREVVPSPEMGDIYGFGIAMTADEGHFWIVEDRAFGSHLTEGFTSLEGVRAEVQRRQSELDALRRATGDAERFHAALQADREAQKDRYASRRRDGGLPRVRSWLAD